MASLAPSEVAAPASNGYIGVISALNSIIYGSSDAESIARRLLYSVDGYCFVTRCFAVQADAVCWLTDPWRASAVVDGDTSVLSSESIGCGSDRVWLATLTKSSRSCVKLDRAGVQRALSSIVLPAAGTCLLGRFCREGTAWSWLGSDSAHSLLQVIDADTPVETRRKQENASVAPLSSTAITPTRAHGDGDAVPAAPSTLECDNALTNVEDPAYSSAMSQESAFSGTAAAVAASLHPLAGPAEQARRPCPTTKSGRGRASRQTAVPSPSRLASRTQASSRGRGSSSAAGLFFRPLGKRAATHNGLDAFIGSDDDNEKNLGSTPGSPLPYDDGEATDEAPFKGKLPKRRKTEASSVAGEPSTLLNPRSSGREPYHGMLSFKEIRKSMAHSRTVWEQQDLLDACIPANKDSCAPPTLPAGAPTAAGVVAGRQCFAGNGGVKRGGTHVAKHLPSKGCTRATAPEALPTTASPTAVGRSSTGVPSTGTRGDGDRSMAIARASAVADQPRVIGRLAAGGDWDAVCDQLWARGKGALVSGGPGTGKSTFLKRFHTFVKSCVGETKVVVVAPTGTSAKTAGGLTYHSFFGFPRGYDAVGLDAAVEAARLLRTPRFGPIKMRLQRTRVVLLDEISLVGADKLDIMYELMVQTRVASSPPVAWFLFGDFLQLKPVLGAVAFKAKCWPEMIGRNFLELAIVHRQDEPDLVQAVHDARIGLCTPTVSEVIAERQVEGASYEAVRDKVLHLMPRAEDVNSHNYSCLSRLASKDQLRSAVATDSARLDPNRDPSLDITKELAVSEASIRAALVDCVAPPCLQHGLHARVMLLDNRRRVIGLCHGSDGTITSYLPDGTPVVRFHGNPLPRGVNVQGLGVQDAGETWVEVDCPAVDFTARILSKPGMLAVRSQLPFVLGWAATVHMAQSLTLSEVVVDLAKAFGAGMVLSAMSRVGKKRNLYVKSFCASRVYADPLALEMYRTWDRL